MLCWFLWPKILKRQCSVSAKIVALTTNGAELLGFTTTLAIVDHLRVHRSGCRGPVQAARVEQHGAGVEPETEVRGALEAGLHVEGGHYCASAEG